PADDGGSHAEPRGPRKLRRKTPSRRGLRRIINDLALSASPPLRVNQLAAQSVETDPCHSERSREAAKSRNRNYTRRRTQPFRAARDSSTPRLRRSARNDTHFGSTPVQPSGYEAAPARIGPA